MPGPQGPSGSCVLLRVDGLGIGYGNRRILADIRFEVPTPGVTVLMGPGGTGKSTLLYWLSGLPAPARRIHSGRAHYQGRPIEDAAERPVLVRQKARQMMGRLVDLLAADLPGRERLTPAQLRQTLVERMESLGLGSMADALDGTAADLPLAGMRLATLLQAALSGSALLLIDEPTAGLAEDDAERVLDVIHELARERACLVVTHNQLHARAIADRVILLAGGRVQVEADSTEFFANAGNHPVLAQFLRTGSCSVPGLDTPREHLVAPGIPGAGQAEAWGDAPPPAEAAPPETSPEPAEPLALTPDTSEFPPDPDAPPSSQGPTGFRWLVRGRIAGCAMPGVVAPVDHDLALLRRMGITVLVNLTERGFPAEALKRHGIRGLSMQIEDRRAPPLLWAKLLLARMELLLREGETIAVHCLAGLGRTGTVLGAWLVREGLTADEALRRLRAIEPGFVQSVEQEELLAELEENLLLRAR